MKNYCIQYRWQGEVWNTVVEARSEESAKAWFIRHYPQVEFIKVIP